IDAARPEVALPFLRERPLADPPQRPADAPLVSLPPRAQPRPRRAAPLEGTPEQVAAAIDAIVREAAGELVLAAGRGAGEDLALYRGLAERYGGSFAVTRPQVEAGRAGRPELVGASSRTVSPAVYLAFGVSGATPHLLGMDRSGIVIAVNTDPGARIFDHADHGAVADATRVAQALAERLSR